MIKHYQQVKLLESDLFESIERSHGKEFIVFPIGINVDSLSTWFLDSMGAFLKKERVLMDLIVDDQEHTHRLMQDGKVGGCISSPSRSHAGMPRRLPWIHQLSSFGHTGIRIRMVP